MFVMLVKYFVIIKRVFKKNHMKNQIILLMMMMMIMIMMKMMVMMLFIDTETILVSSLMSNWRYTIQNTQNQSGTSFHKICKEYKQII